MSPRTATKNITPTDDDIEPSTEPQLAEYSMQTSATSDSMEAISMDSCSVAVVDESPTDAAGASGSPRGLQDASALAESESQAKPEVDIADVASEPQFRSDAADINASVIADVECATTQELPTADGPDPLNSQDDQSSSTLKLGAQSVTAGVDDPTPGLPDPSGISGRLQHLVIAVAQVEELSRRAREAAASDLALYNGIAASQRQFEEGLAEAQRIG